MREKCVRKKRREKNEKRTKQIAAFNVLLLQFPLLKIKQTTNKQQQQRTDENKCNI